MRPYFAIVQDSFREAFRSPVLWIVLALVTLILLMLAPLGYHEVSTTRIAQHEVEDWPGFAQRVREDGNKLAASPGKRIWTRIDPKLQNSIANLKLPQPGNLESLGEFSKTIEGFSDALNDIIAQRDFYDAATWRNIDLGIEGRALVKADGDKLTNDEVGRLNRILVERAFPDFVDDSPATSTIVTYAVWDLQSPMPIRQEQFHSALRTIVNLFNNWFIGGLGVLIAIIITAPIVPRMFDQGQLHLLLSKPVTRSLLFVSQFLGGCAYITIVATYLVVGLWLILGLRFNLWDARFLWLIPIYTFVFAVYYCVSAMFGVMFRNSIVSIAASMLFWMVCFTLGTSKLSLEEMYVNKQRLNKVVPAGQALLGVSEQNMVYAWNPETNAWDNVFVSKEQKQLQSFAMLLPALPPMIGPAYNPARDEIVAVERSFGRGGQLVLGIGKASQEWSHTPAATSPPIGTFALLREPRGSLLFAANLGLFRLQGDPLKPAAPVKVLGFQLPVPAAGPFVNVAPDGTKTFVPPAAAAIDPISGDVAIVARGNLQYLRLESNAKFAAAATKQLEGNENEAVVVAIAGEKLILGRSDGRVQTLQTSDLKELSSEKLEPDSTVRFFATAPDRKQVAALFHNGALWLFDTQTAKWSRPRITGQGNLSAANWSDANELLLVDRATRVSVYQGNDLALVTRYAPRLSVMEFAYHYAIVPLYTILPKPGEMYKTFEYILSGQATSASDSGEDASSVQRPLRPWAPVWSGLLFIGVVLLLTCVYFERQEY